MTRFIKLFSPLLVLSLAACSTVTEGSQQQVSFTTTGAEGALCQIKQGVNGRSYTVRPPQTIWMKKSIDDLTIDCDAPGNRIVRKVVESDVAATTFLNPLNGLVPGLAYDGESGAMFKYPETIDIDFSNVVAKANAMPAYHNLDTLDPNWEAGVEDYGPDVPKANDDNIVALRHKLAADQAAREEAAAAALAAEKEARINAVEGGFYGDKGNTTK